MADNVCIISGKPYLYYITFVYTDLPTRSLVSLISRNMVPAAALASEYVKHLYYFFLYQQICVTVYILINRECFFIFYFCSYVAFCLFMYISYHVVQLMM